MAPTPMHAIWSYSRKEVRSFSVDIAICSSALRLSSALTLDIHFCFRTVTQALRSCLPAYNDKGKRNEGEGAYAYCALSILGNLGPLPMEMCLST